jgi:hypothetical protein
MSMTVTYMHIDMYTYICYPGAVKRTTIFLPEDLHERLRREAFRKRVSMAELIRSRLETKSSTSRAARKKRRSWEDDPLLKVAGIFSDGTLSQGIDEDLYGI